MIISHLHSRGYIFYILQLANRQHNSSPTFSCYAFAAYYVCSGFSLQMASLEERVKVNGRVPEMLSSSHGETKCFRSEEANYFLVPACYFTVYHVAILYVTFPVNPRVSILRECKASKFLRRWWISLLFYVYWRYRMVEYNENQQSAEVIILTQCLTGPVPPRLRHRPWPITFVASWHDFTFSRSSKVHLYRNRLFQMPAIKEALFSSIVLVSGNIRYIKIYIYLQEITFMTFLRWKTFQFIFESY